MTQLELAIKYLGKRTISAEESTKDDFLVANVVLPAAEVFAILDMVQKETFQEFYNTMKDLEHSDFV